MNKIAIFGKPGGGKSTFSQRLAANTGIPYYALDRMQYQANGTRRSAAEYASQHAALLAKSQWIIDGLGSLESFWQRIETADTLIYLDLPYPVHYWWVTKRLLMSLFTSPEGWPDGSSVLQGTLSSYKYLRLSPKFWTPQLLIRIQQRAQGKDFYRLTSAKAINNLLSQLQG